MLQLETPVDEIEWGDKSKILNSLTSVPKIWILAVLRGERQDLLQDLLRVRGTAAWTYLVDPLDILPDDPDNAGPGLRFVQGVEIITDSGDDGLVLVGTLHENVLGDDNSVLDLGLDSGSVRRRVDTQRSADCSTLKRKKELQWDQYKRTKRTSWKGQKEPI